MNEYVDINTCATLLNDAWTVYLTFCGILVSIITLLYSFIMGKRNELYIYAEQSKLGNKDPLIKKRQMSASKYIKQMKSIIKWCVIMLVMSFSSCFISWLCIRFLTKELYLEVLLIIVVLTLLIIAGTLGLIRRLIRQYNVDTKIQYIVIKTSLF